jgi:hypothetical protein
MPMVFFMGWVFIFKNLLFIGFDNLKSFPHFKCCMEFNNKTPISLKTQ